MIKGIVVAEFTCDEYSCDAKAHGLISMTPSQLVPPDQPIGGVGASGNSMFQALADRYIEVEYGVEPPVGWSRSEKGNLCRCPAHTQPNDYAFVTYSTL